MKSFVELWQENIHNSLLEPVSDELHFWDIHIVLKFPSIVLNVGKFRGWELNILFSYELDRGVELFWISGRIFGGNRVVSVKIPYKYRHVSIGWILKAHSYEVICVYQGKAHFWSFLLEHVEYSSYFKGWHYVFKEFLDVLIILSSSFGVNNVLEKFVLLVRNYFFNMLQFLQRVIDMKAVEDAFLS